jgi:hypothetical protein
MHITAHVVLLVLAAVCFVIAAYQGNTPPWPRPSIVALGLALGTVALLVN